MIFSIAAGGLALTIWLLLVFARGNFWRLSKIVVPNVAPPSPARVVAVIPARNEAEVIARCLESLLSFPDSELVHVFVVNDHSTDATSALAIEVGAKLGQKARLTVMQSAPLPDGWLGKLWAVQQGIDCALALMPEFLLLTDADIAHDLGSLAGLIQIAREAERDLVSAMVRLQCKTVAEKLLIPAFTFFFFKLYPPEWIANPKKSAAGAAGGCVLVRPEAILRAGGIAAIRNQIIDDCALARAVKQSGGSLWLGLAPQSFSLRSYGSFSEIWKMIARTAFNQLRHSTLMLVATIAGMMLIYVFPFALLGVPALSGKILGIASIAAMCAAYYAMISFYRLNPIWVLSLPLAAIFYTGATIWSAMSYCRGRGGEWKGRHQDKRIATS